MKTKYITAYTVINVLLSQNYHLSPFAPFAGAKLFPKTIICSFTSTFNFCEPLTINGGGIFGENKCKDADVSNLTFIQVQDKDDEGNDVGQSQINRKIGSK